PRGCERAQHDPGLYGDECLREAVRGLGDSLRGAPAPADRSRGRAARPPLAARVLAGLREGAHLVDVRVGEAGRELRDPDDVVASRRAGLDVKRRGALDGVRIRNWLRRAAEDVGRLDLGGEAGGVGRDDDARKLDGTLRIQDDAYARLALLEVAVLLGGPERGAVAVRNFRRFLGMLA